MNTKIKTAIYWATTGLLALSMTASAFMYFTAQPPVQEGLKHLGYPAFLLTLLGTWKLLGAMAIVAPKLPRLKEWAYAGFAFNLTGAAYSHLMAGDPAPQVVTPLIVLAIAMVSWGTRSGARAWPELGQSRASPQVESASPDLRLAA